MYWDQVLTEVLRKNLPQQNCLVTSVNEYTTQADKAKTTRRKAGKSSKNTRQKFYLGPCQPGIYFTLREMQTIEQIIAGKNVPQTADALGTSTRTIEFYIRNMRGKLNCPHRADLVSKILRCEIKFISPPSDTQLWQRG